MLKKIQLQMLTVTGQWQLQVANLPMIMHVASHNFMEGGKEQIGEGGGQAPQAPCQNAQRMAE